jgi:hypothetical protein
MTTKQRDILAYLADQPNGVPEVKLLEIGCCDDATLLALARPRLIRFSRRGGPNPATSFSLCHITEKGMLHLQGSRTMVSVGDDWTCPHCGRAQVVSEDRYYRRFHALYSLKGWKDGDPGIDLEAINCANHSCRRITLEMTLSSYETRDSEPYPVGPFKHWALLPDSLMKPQPDYIPQPIRDDYAEACLIRDRSPKASATITRRCLQGMIRDFCGISKRRLVDEIDELRNRVQSGQAPGVQPDSVEAIDLVRKIGNIGAHMEADINVIVDVDPGEAQVLIELIELLFEEWYVARHMREQGFARLKSIAEEKDKQKKQLPPSK